MPVSAPQPTATLATRRSRLVAGTMTGTSIDGELDAALVKIVGHGVSMRATIVATRSWPLGSVAADLRRIAAQEPLPAREFSRISRAFGEVHADALCALCSDAGVEPELAVLHGQTVFHAPPLTWQLVDPWPTATRLNCRVRYDLRSANVASGGQGAPITPIADFVLFADDSQPTIVVNLGGFVNATIVPSRSESIERIRGCDIVACNHLLDGVAKRRLHRAYDADGAAAMRGKCDEAICERVMDVLAPNAGLHAAPRSLGTGDEAIAMVSLTDELNAEDACATIVEAIARCIVRGLRRALTDFATTNETSDETRVTTIPLLIAGGSARNRALHAALERAWDGTVRTTHASHSIAVGMREAAAMAILGALTDDGIRYSLAHVTGASSHPAESSLIEKRAVSPTFA